MHKYVLRSLCGAVLIGVIALTITLLSGRFGVGHRTVSAQSSVQLVPVVSNLSSPLYVTNAHDGSGRLFIVEQAGRILVLPQGASSPLPTPFLDIRARILSGGERGLLGLAFHPQYAGNGRFFVNYTRLGDGATVISEFTVSGTNPNVANTTERIILTIPQPFANHNGGMIEFGTDGYLYIGMGDGGSGNDPGNRAQNINDLLGKMLRIDINTPNGATPYSSPSTNPFFGATPGRDEIYALGLRNPFRWSFDRATGELWAGDVGQGVIEEIDRITLGGNYGWRILEGTRCTNIDPLCDAPGFIPPVTQYDHSGGRCSVTGGYVYHGASSAFAPGTYIFGDFCTGEIFTWNNNAMTLLMDTDMQLASFGQDEAGEMYAVGLEGRIFRLTGPALAVISVSATNYRGGLLAPESIAAAFGANFSTTTASAPAGQPLPTTLAGASVTVTDTAGTGRQAPLYFVSPNQINYLIPTGTAIGNATITYNNSSGVVGTNTVTITNVAPGFFTVDSTGRGLPIAFIQRVSATGTSSFEPLARFDTATNQWVAIPIDLGPATDQVYLAIFGSGFRGRSSLSAVTAFVGETAAQVTYAGTQGQFIGVDQTNILLPRTLAGRGDVNVVTTFDGQSANTVRINIR